MIAHGYEVINAQCPFYKIDFENMAQTIELFSAMDFEHSRGVDAIVHLAANATVIRSYRSVRMAESMLA